MAHGSPNYCHSAICAMQNGFACADTLGASGPPAADYANAKLVMIWGKQPVYSGASKGGTRFLVEAKERGTKIIAIKPSLEPDAALADRWVAIRPGTAAALGRACRMRSFTKNSHILAF